MENKLLTKKDIQQGIPAFRGVIGGMFASLAMHVCGLHKVNRLYIVTDHTDPVNFSKSVFEKAGIKLDVRNIEVLERFKDKPFVTVSNHPYGHIDGLALIGIIGSLRDDYMVQANFILSLIKPLAEKFIVINPYRDGDKTDVTAIDCTRRCISHLEEGHPLGFFPAAAVSMPYKKGLKFTVYDKPWKMSTVKMIVKSEMPVIPVYFGGQNSWFFNVLGTISWKLRSIWLPREICNKRGKTIKIVFGEPIMPEELQKIGNIRETAEFLRAKTYELGGIEAPPEKKKRRK